MPRRSVKENKPSYQLKREELGLSREKAARMLDGITEDRLEGIENGRVKPTPDDIVQFAQHYDEPRICNDYCSSQCAIGRRYVPHVEMKDLREISLCMLSSINAVSAMKERLTDIVADGAIDKDEEAEFRQIQGQLEQLSMTVEALQLWAEKALPEG